MKLSECYVGQRITYSGYPGAVRRFYHGSMVEIQLASGQACVDVHDLVPLAIDRPSDVAAVYAAETGCDYSTALARCNMD